MSALNLVHLHLHTDASFLDGIGRPEEYASLAKQYHMPAIGISDHGNMHGMPAFRKALKAEGIKPLYGVEFYLNQFRDKIDRVRTQSEDKPSSGWDSTLKNNHQLLIAMDATGWQNLLKLNHDSVLNGYYYYPRTTVDKVIEHNAGLICTTTCTTSIFSRMVQDGKLDECSKMIARFKEAFGDRFYFELQPWNFPEQKKLNEFLVRMMKKHKVEPVLTCDVHYATASDKARQLESFAGRFGKTLQEMLSDPKSMVGNTASNYFMSADEACALYEKNGNPGGRKMAEHACRNTVRIADRCNVDIYPDDKLKPPVYRDEQGNPVSDSYETLKTLAIAGFKSIVRPNVEQKKIDTYKSRLLKELKIIKNCQMSDFYLVTMDIVKECHRRGIFVWVRGSGCASLVAACLSISQIDPIRHKLLFERFIDPHRPNAPDFDLDIDATRRSEIVDFVTKKYGGKDGENIARIIAIQTYGLKAALNAVTKAHDVEGSIAWKLSDAAATVTQDKKVEASLASCTVNDRQVLFDDVRQRLQDAVSKPIADWIDSHTDIIDAAFTLVGRKRGRARHAAGYVITPTPIIEHLPIDRLPGDTKGEHVICTAWGEGQASTDISPAGLMKIDLLGLDTITVVSKTIQLASKRHGKDVWSEVNPWTMDFEDPDVAAEFSTGRGIGLHQLSEVDQGLTRFAKELRPKSVDDVTAMVAMYRPGSIGFLEPYKLRAHGREEIESVHPIYDKILADTYGIIVYQEQIMHILNRLGGIELRKAYDIIKAISKKKLDVIKSARDEFIKGVKKNNIGQNEAIEIFDLIEKFAGYGFNKAHSASYGTLSWITAYLRHHYPLEFYVCLLNATPNKIKRKKGQLQDRKLDLVMRQAQASGIKLKPPAIGLSTGEWRIGKGNTLIAPLSIIKSVGDQVGNHLQKAFKSKSFHDVYSFLDWAESNKGKINSGALKSCAKAGAFRTFKITPVQAHDLVTCWVGKRVSKKNGTRTEQLKHQLKDDGEFVYVTQSTPETRMDFERDALGFTFWCNPWKMYERMEKITALHASGKIQCHTERRLRDKRRPFLVTGIRKHVDKRGGKMAFITLCTLDDEKVKAVAFSRTWAKCKAVEVDKVYLISGTFEHGDYIISDVKKPFIDVDNVELNA